MWCPTYTTLYNHGKTTRYTLPLAFVEMHAILCKTLFQVYASKPYALLICDGHPTHSIKCTTTFQNNHEI